MSLFQWPRTTNVLERRYWFEYWRNGSCIPVPFADEKFCKAIQETIVKPTIDGLKKDNIPYVVCIYRIDSCRRCSYVIEYNVRMGDPETKSFYRIKNDMAEMLHVTAMGKLDQVELIIEDQSATTVVAVSVDIPRTTKRKNNKRLAIFIQQHRFSSGHNTPRW